MVSMRRAAVATALLTAAWCGQAAAAIYNVVIVEFAYGREDFSTGGLQGRIDGTVSTTNLPGAVSSRVDYTYGPTGGYAGTWRLSAGGSNFISGVYATQGRTPTSGWSSIGTITIDGGEGAFLNASGGGTFEAFTREVAFAPFETFYEQVTITRLQFSAANGPEQVDFRPVSVSARVGFSDDNTGHGANTGVATSDSNPILLPNVRSEWYSSAGGKSTASDGLGNSMNWIYTTDPGSGPIGPVWYKSFGDATVVDGTGEFVGYTGGSTWEAYSVGLGAIGNGVWAHQAGTIDRYTINAPIPEPQTYALMAAGLAFASFAAIRRRRQDPGA